MFLKSLTIKGFKSFAELTTLEFEPGVTVVVGPNGSGKSNIVDAVAWVLGAQGPRGLRSAKMEDVIFAGTPKRPALGRAEVSLTIDNSAGLLPIEFTEVTITRTLFRGGDSEYAINRVPCRLLDIQELLSDTGVGRQQHVIVSQGNLDSVLSAQPEERRLVIEEAAGILKYRRRKEKAERRLESTEANLVRLQDLLREVRRQLRPLEKQAEAARRHGDLLAELLALRRYLAGRELVLLEARLAGSARSLHELHGQEEELRSELARLDAEVLSAEAELSAAGAGGPEGGELLSRAEAARARARGLAALLAERRRSLERELAAGGGEELAGELKEEAASLSSQLEAMGAEQQQLAPLWRDLEAMERVLAGDQAELERRERARGEAEAREGEPGEDEATRRHIDGEDGREFGDNARREVAAGPRRPGDAAAEVRGQLCALRSTLEGARGELRRLEERLEGLSRRAGQLSESLRHAEDERSEAVSAEARLREELESAAAATAEAEVQLLDASEDRRRAEADQHRWTARHEALLQALEESRARAGAARLASVEGMVGILLELVEVESGFHAAFEAAAGEALGAVVVEDATAARRCLAELESQAAGGAVLVCSSSSASDAAVHTWEASSGHGWDRVLLDDPSLEALRDKVRGRAPGLEELLDRLLSRAVVVRGDWRQALEVSAAHPEAVVVTAAGDRFSPTGWRLGAGGGNGATGAALAEAAERAEAAESRAREAAEAEGRAAERASAARAALAKAERAALANSERLRGAMAAEERAKAELVEVHREIESAATQKAEVAERLAGEEARAAELESLLPALEASAARAEEEELAGRAERARLMERAADLAARRRQLEVRAAALEERRSLLARRREEVEARLAQHAAGLAVAAERREHLLRMARVVSSLSALVEGKLLSLEELVARLRSAYEARTDALRRLSERLELLRKERSAAERQLGELRERAGRVSLEEAESRVRLESLVETVRSELDCEPESLRDAQCPPLPPGTSAQSRRSELERELRLMGPVNPLALEEHAALEERHRFLEAQLEDVRSARRDLMKVIRAVDAEIVDIFRAAYADVADNFEKLFKMLFAGGEGRLKLTDPDRLLETGVEIEARPPGKNVRRLSLLSGGERSLTALAFLFAVFRSRPSPFYLMDEVEAALDDVSLHRFLELVREFRDEAQLVIVTHQKRTMEAADCLYGVTMPPGGSSRVVSERINATVG